MKAGWEKKTSAAGEVYYVNHTTKETSWARPVGPPAAVSPRDAASSTDHVETSLPPGETFLYLDTAPIHGTFSVKALFFLVTSPATARPVDIIKFMAWLRLRVAGVGL